MAENPKKSPRSKRITLNDSRNWKSIIEGVDKKEVPVNILQEISVKLVDGTVVTVDVKQLLRDGMRPLEIEKMLDEKFYELDAYILNVDFLVDIDKVASTIKPETDKVLKNL